MQYTTDVRIIRLMCTGRVDPTMVSNAFLQGADGMIVVGCHFGDCHYITGNFQGKVKMGLASRTLSYVGVNPQRISFSQCSGAEGERFVSLISGFDKTIKELGPLGGGADRLPLAELKERIEIAGIALGKEKLRWVVGKFTEFEVHGNKYGERFTEHEMWRTLNTIVMDEIATYEIMREMKEGPASVKDLASKLELRSPDVLRYMLALQRRGFVDLAGIDGSTPRYRLVVDPAAVAA